MVEDMVEGTVEVEEEGTVAVVVVVATSKEDMVVVISKEDMVEEDTAEDTVEVEVEATKVVVFAWFLKSTDMVCIRKIMAWAGNVIVIALIKFSFLCFLSLYLEKNRTDQYSILACISLGTCRRRLGSFLLNI